MNLNNLSLQYTKDKTKTIKKLIWVYILLLFFEGALRKWILPSLSEPLLIIRDPFALLIILKAISLNVLKPNPLLSGFILIGIISFIAAILFGHQNIMVATYGVRPILLHFPLIFIIGNVFSRKDVQKVGVFLLYLLIPMTIITVIQFYSPQSSFINHGVGNTLEGAGFGGAMGYFRPPGTFSFINGLSLFYGLSASFVFYFLFQRGFISKWLVLISALCLLLAIPFTISRMVFFQTLLCFLFSFIFIFKNPKYIFSILLVGISTVLLFIYMQTSETFSIGIDAFMSRLQSANESEGGIQGTLIDRMFGTLFSSIENAFDESLWGTGIGANTNVGLKILGANESVIISDFEWSRTINEMGALLGVFFLFTRVMLTFKLVKGAIKNNRKKYYLTWMLLSFSLLQMFQGQIAQPTSIGFIVLSAGLSLATIIDKNLQVNS